MSTPTLHLLMGLPGSGKTTVAKQIQKLTGAVRLSSDDFRLMIFPEPTFSQKEHDDLYRILDHNVEHMLAAGMSVVYDANLNRHKHRQEKYDIAQKHNATVRLWWLRTPDELSKRRRVADQNTLLIPEGETSEKMFDRITQVFEQPTKYENPFEIDGSTITEASVQAILDKNVVQSDGHTADTSRARDMKNC